MSEEKPHPLTPAGKGLFVCTLLLFASTTYLLFTDVFTHLPVGSYPVFYLLAPTGIAITLLFFLVSWLLRRRGIAVFTAEVEEVREAYRRRKRPNKAPEPTPGSVTPRAIDPKSE